MQSAEKVHHPLFARLYMRTASSKEGEYRRELLAGLAGEVIEVGAGHGLNFAFYPEAARRVLAVEPERSAARGGDRGGREGGGRSRSGRRGRWRAPRRR